MYNIYVFKDNVRIFIHRKLIEQKKREKQLECIFALGTLILKNQ